MTKTLKNDPVKKGQLASRKISFGNNRRYAYAPVHTRFDAVQWFIWDAETPDADGNPEIIRQHDHFSDVETFMAKAKDEENSAMDAEAA